MSEILDYMDRWREWAKDQPQGKEMLAAAATMGWLEQRRRRVDSWRERRKLHAAIETIRRSVNELC